jgi:hypothetical protein
MSTFWALNDSLWEVEQKDEPKKGQFLSQGINEWNLWEMYMKGVGQWGMN